MHTASLIAALLAFVLGLLASLSFIVPPPKPQHATLAPSTALAVAALLFVPLHAASNA